VPLLIGDVWPGRSPLQIFEYNGSALVAMVGRNCFAIASDRRLGVQLQTIGTDFQRVFKIHDKLYIGLSGLVSDAQTLWVSRILFRLGRFVCLARLLIQGLYYAS
jgi:20S proteasome alpha/beta subunit